MQTQRALFSLDEQVSYLNMAYMSPLLKSVEEVGREAVSRKAKPYEVRPEDFFNQVERLKKIYADLVSTDEWRRVAILPSVSYGMANVARNLQPHAGDEILVVSEQFPSNRYPWERLAREYGAVIKEVDTPEVGTGRGEAWNQAILQAITEKTILVALPVVHWADGTKFDLTAIREATKAYGALLVIDGTQSVGALPLSIAELQPDALICGGYKWLLGPYSIGLGYYGPYFDPGVPIEENWINRLNAEDFTGLVNYQPRYGPKAQRYNVGEHSNFILVPMMIRALEQIQAWTISAIQQYCSSISARAIKEFEAMGCQVEHPDYRGGHLFGVRFSDTEIVKQLQTHLPQKHIYVSFRGNAMRVSPYVYNSAADFDRLLAEVQTVMSSPIK